MKIFGRRIKCASDKEMSHPVRRRGYSPSIWIPMEPESLEDSELQGNEEKCCNLMNVNAFLSLPRTRRRLEISYSMPTPEQNPPRKIRHSKSIANFEIDRTQKLRRLSRWKLVGNLIPFIGYCKTRDKSTCDRLNTRLLDAIEARNNEGVERLLKIGASPNATCRASHISACHAAASDNNGALRLLLQHKAESDRRDKFGRTPLHLAVWAGDTLAIAMILAFPIDLQTTLTTNGITTEVESQIRNLKNTLDKRLIEVPCDLGVTTKMELIWNDSIEHKCRKYKTDLPKFFSGWTPLHIASYAAHHGAARLLLAAGASPNTKDAMGRTPLDVAGTACFRSTNVDVKEYVKTIQSLIEFGGKVDVVGTAPSNSALHTAVELDSVEAVQLLLAVGAPIHHQNTNGNTPLHECVGKYSQKMLKVLANHRGRDQSYRSIDVKNRFGYTVLHDAIFSLWIPGVCIALKAGADVTFEASDGKTALHIAAQKGDLDILDELFVKAAENDSMEKIINYNNKRTEPPIFSAIRSGSLECVQAFLDVGAALKMAYYIEPTTGITIVPTRAFEQTPNMILHATAEVGNVEILELLFNHDKNLEDLLLYKCLYLEAMIPVEFAAHHNNLGTFKYLLQKTIQLHNKSKQIFDHSRLLHIIATKNYEHLFQELIEQIPDAVRKLKNVPNRSVRKNKLIQIVKRKPSTQKEYYPLHEAAKQNNRNLVVQLLHNGADLSEIDQYGCTAASIIMNNISKPINFLEKVFDDYIYPISNEDRNSESEIVIDYRVLIPKSLDTTKNQEQLRVLTTFLKTDSCPYRRKLLGHPLIESFLYLKWKTLSTFFYCIVLFYGLFVMSLSIYTMSIFYFKDENNNNNNKTSADDVEIPMFWDPYIWQFVVYVTFAIVLLQELSHLDLALNSWSSKVLSKEFWAKFIGYILASVTCSVVSMKSEHIVWERYLAAATLVITWMNLMILFSKTPKAGYYIQMFWKVTSKVVEILVAFMILIIMFTCCFMILFQSREPFNGPWAAFVQTLVMMMSEFNYQETFSTHSDSNLSNLSTPLPLLRLIFVLFLILTAIVLMNLMIGVAVDNVQYLIHDGNLKRLQKQVVFLSNLEQSRQNSFFYLLGLYKWFDFDDVPSKVKIKPVNDDECHYSPRIKEAIINKAQEQLDQIDKEVESVKLELKLDEHYKNLLREMFELKAKLNDLKPTQ